MRAAGHEDPQFSIGMVWEGGPRGLDHHRANRISREMRLRGHVIGKSAKHLEALGDRLGPVGEKPVGAADDGVAFMQKHRHAKPGRRQHGRHRRIAAKANHRARTDLFKEPPRGAGRADDRDDRPDAQHKRAPARGRGGQSVNGMGGEIAAVFRRPLIRDEMHLEAARGESMAQRRRRKQMAAGAARRDGHRALSAHAKTSVLASERSAAPGRLRKTAIRKPIASASEISDEPP